MEGAFCFQRGGHSGSQFPNEPVNAAIVYRVFQSRMLAVASVAVITLQRQYSFCCGHEMLCCDIADDGAGPRISFGFAVRGAHAAANGDAIGWTTDTEGFHHRSLFIENGRIADRPGHQLRTALRTIAMLPEFIDRGTVVLTTNQNVVLARATDAERARIDAILAEAGVGSRQSVVRENAMACVALPTCGLALAESERFLPGLIDEIDELLKLRGLETQKITVRMTGCPNGCARPYIAEIGLIGRNPGRYNLHVGGAADGSRLNRLLRENADRSEILSILDGLFARYAAERSGNEGFGDFVQRVHVWA